MRSDCLEISVKYFLPTLLMLSLSVACRKAPSSPPAVASGPPAPGAAQTPTAKPMPAQLPAILAKVDGEAIERGELENAVKGIEARAGSAIPAERRDEILRGVLDQLVDFHVLAQESRARKVEVSDAEIETRLTEIKR